MTVRDRIRNQIRRRIGMQVDLSGRVVERCFLRWFRHVKSMNDKRLAKRVYESGVKGRWSREDQKEFVWIVSEKL